MSQLLVGISLRGSRADEQRMRERFETGEPLCGGATSMLTRSKYTRVSARRPQAKRIRLRALIVILKRSDSPARCTSRRDEERTAVTELIRGSSRRLINNHGWLSIATISTRIGDLAEESGRRIA